MYPRIARYGKFVVWIGIVISPAISVYTLAEQKDITKNIKRLKE
jgi:hypothetical protein